MNVDKLKQAMDYSDVFKIIANGTCNMEELDAKLKDKAANSSALQRRRKWLSDTPAYLTIEDGQISFDVGELAQDLSELRKLVIPERFDSDGVQEMEAEIEMLKRQIDDLTTELQEYS